MLAGKITRARAAHLSVAQLYFKVIKGISFALCSDLIFLFDNVTNKTFVIIVFSSLPDGAVKFLFKFLNKCRVFFDFHGGQGCLRVVVFIFTDLQSLNLNTRKTFLTLWQKLMLHG